jgi:hypothetical protein
MSTETASFLASFDALPAGTKSEVAAEIVRRAAGQEHSGDGLLPPDEWSATLRAWVATRPTHNPSFVFDRGSLYDGRGE